MTTVRITPYKNDYVAEVEILNKKLSYEEIKNIQYKLNTYWADEVANRIKDYDENKCIVEFPKSCFINNNGGYDFKDVVKEIVKPVDNIVFEQISSVIEDVDVIQWALEDELEYYVEMDDYESIIKEAVREAYEEAFDDDLDKIDYISSTLYSVLTKKPIINTIGNYRTIILDAIEDEMADGWLYIYNNPHTLIEEDYGIYDYVEEDNLSEENIEYLRTIIQYAENYQYDKAIAYIEGDK